MHPDLIQSLNNLAALFYSQGRYEEAKQLCGRILAIREKTLGPDHPDMAACLESYADLLRKSEDRKSEEAEKIKAQAAAIRARGGGWGQQSINRKNRQTKK